MKSYPAVTVTIDGPAGAGKSTVARRLASALGFEFLDTGAFYRAVTLAVLRRQVDPQDTARVAQLAESLRLENRGRQMLMDGEDVSEAIRTPEVGRAIGAIADNVAVRQILTRQQRESAAGRRIVTEGRDQGTVVFPDATCKIFLTAGREERARRRLAQLQTAGVAATLEQVLADQDRRDAQDQARPTGALRPAEDAYRHCTDGQSQEEVVQRLLEIVRGKLAARPLGAAHRSGAV